MREYQEALCSIVFTMHNRVKPKALGHCEDTNFDILEELVEKETPKKPLKDYPSKIEYIDTYTCPNCGGTFSSTLPNYCYHCGQKLDWSKE